MKGKNMTAKDLFNGINPLDQPAALEVNIPGITPAMGKVRAMFRVPDQRIPYGLGVIDLDHIGAFDQKHLITNTTLRAHYPGKGILTRAFTEWGKMTASALMPTDFLPPDLAPIPSEYWSRYSCHIPASQVIPIEFIVRSSCEGSMAEKASKGELICGQKLPEGIQFGQMLPRPFFTPTTKAPQGEKDRELPLEEYFSLVYKITGDSRIAHYLYGMAVLIHLYHRILYAEKGLARLDQKFEFGIFAPAPIYSFKGVSPLTENWGRGCAQEIFFRLFRKARIPYTSFEDGTNFNWEKALPLFDFELFREFAEEINYSGIIRLLDETGGTDDGRVRTIANTHQGLAFLKADRSDLAEIFLGDYLCKEHFRQGSKATLQGGYDKSATATVYVPWALCRETGRRNLQAYLMLMA